MLLSTGWAAIKSCTCRLYKCLEICTWLLIGSVINSAHKLCISGMVLRVGRSSLLFPEEIEVKTSQWLRQKAPCWNYFLLMPKPFHRLIFLCSFRVMLSRKGRKSQVWNQINQQKISTRKYFKYFFPFFLLVCITEISFQVLISNVYFTDMRNFILSCLLNIQNVPTWNLTHSIRYSACADAVLKCLN